MNLYFTIGGLILIVVGWYYWNQKKLKSAPVKPEVCKQCGNIPQIYFGQKERAMAIRRGEMCCCQRNLFVEDPYLELEDQQIIDIKKFWKVAGIGLTKDIDAFCLVFPSAESARKERKMKEQAMREAEDQLE